MRDSTLIPMDQFVSRFGGSHEVAMYWLDRAKGSVEPDWDGSPAVPRAKAQAAYEAWEKAREENDRRWQAYQDYLARRALERTEAGMAAYNKALAAERDRAIRAYVDSGGVSSGGMFMAGDPANWVYATTDRQRAGAARLKALQDFDRKRPELAFDPEVPASKWESR